MLFNSYGFLIVFLPATLLGFGLLAGLGRRRLSASWLIAASLFFYGWWDIRFVPLLVGSVAVNFLIGAALGQRRAAGRDTRLLLALGVAANLAVLAWFKYAGFIAGTIAALSGAGLTAPKIVLPLAISFFTFQQISYLVDAHRGRAAGFGLVEYGLFVTFFPQLIAGPIVYWREVMPQYVAQTFGRLEWNNVMVGLAIFAIGLFKKVVLADYSAIYADPVFAAALKGVALSPPEAWVGALAYSFQLYFDFSGYSDMAIGLAWMFGVRLPMNFASPYKAPNIIEFWRRWHMTLSRFLRDYLYFPLGGNRRGDTRRYVNLAIVMLLGGLWHGAGWTFVLWGAIHGAYLMINHAWRAVRRAVGRADASGSAVMHRLANLLTFLSVTAAWVVFRAEDFDAAIRMWRAMAGLDGLFVPEWAIRLLGLSKTALVASGELFPHYFPNNLFYYQDPLGPWLAVLLLIVLYAPNAMEIMGRFTPALEPWRGGAVGDTFTARRIAWRPSVAWGSAIGVILAIAFMRLSAPSPFLYFQF